MMLCSISNSVEFYVVLFTVGAAIVALCARPADRGPVVTHLFNGSPAPSSGSMPSPAIFVRRTGECGLQLTRTGIRLTPDAEVTYALSRRGAEILIEELIVTSGGLQPLNEPTASCDLQFTASEIPCDRLSIRFESRSLSIMAVMTLPAGSGASSWRPLNA